VAAAHFHDSDGRAALSFSVGHKTYGGEAGVYVDEFVRFWWSECDSSPKTLVMKATIHPSLCKPWCGEKLQAPTSNIQRSSRNQISNPFAAHKFGTWNLEFVWSLDAESATSRFIGVGAWCFREAGGHS
jgi:hypothetical protein